MSNNDSPITPPPELVQDWWEEADQHVDRDDPKTYFDYIATQAARWGADQQLEACCEYIGKVGAWFANPKYRLRELRAALRQKPPSLKEKALKAIGMPAKIGEARVIEHREHELIRRALEQLPD